MHAVRDSEAAERVSGNQTREETGEFGAAVTGNCNKASSRNKVNVGGKREDLFGRRALRSVESGVTRGATTTVCDDETAGQSTKR